MEKELHAITIIPARFIEKQEKGYVIRCLIDDDRTEDRLFDEFSLMGMTDPEYLFIGIMTGVGYCQINFTEAGQFKKYFRRRWKILVK
jgi:hypothetical protein